MVRAERARKGVAVAIVFAIWGCGGERSLREPPRAADSSGVAPPPPSLCDGISKKPLPYVIAPDFSYPLTMNAIGTLAIMPGFDCNQMVFSDLATGDGAAGDGAVNDAGPSTAENDSGPGVAAPDVGECLVIRYDPDDCNATFAAASTASCWAAVILTPSPRGSNGPGICIAPGATAVHFKARASRDGARVKFGSIREGLDSTEFYLNVTTKWVDYTVSIPTGEDYDHESPAGGVWDGFSIVVEPQDHVGGTYVFVSDVVWVDSP
jgi:hypothetical protein